MGSLPTRIFLFNNQWTSQLLCLKCSSFKRLAGPLANANRLTHYRHYSSKTPINSSVVVPTISENTAVDLHPPPEPTATVINVPHFSASDVRYMDTDAKLTIHNTSVAVAKAQASSLVANTRVRRRKEILIMDESEYADKHVLKNKPPLLDRRGELESFFFRRVAPERHNQMDQLCFIQADIDLRQVAIKRWYEKKKLESAIDSQRYIANRTKLLGHDLAAAHVIVARGGKVKFMGHKTWVTEYRKDAKPGVSDEDLPVMSFELCTLPVNFDPRYRLEIIDASGLELHYEGLENFENLDYVKGLSLRNSLYIDDWCLDRIARQLGETLEFIDLSGCTRVTDKGIGTLHRCSNLKAIHLENMGHLENLEIVCALLEDHNPGVEVIGIDYETKAEQLRLQGEEWDNKAMQIEATNMNNSCPCPPLLAAEVGTQKSLNSTNGNDTLTATPSAAHR